MLPVTVSWKSPFLSEKKHQEIKQEKTPFIPQNVPGLRVFTVVGASGKDNVIA